MKIRHIFIILFVGAMLSVNVYAQDTQGKNSVALKDGYSNFSFTVQEENSLDALIRSYGSGVSVFYKDLKSGYTYTNNEHQKYFIASIIKAPYCMYVYDCVSKGELDLNTRYTYSARHRAGGTGIMKNMASGKTFSLEEILTLAITESDNGAMNMLKEICPVAGYRQYAKQLGLHHFEDVKNATNGDITAIDAGVYIEAIYHFINTNPYGENLREHMLSTRNPMIVSAFPVVRKYGWAKTYYHDMAIVEAPNPYLLCICTNKDGNVGIFRKISGTIEQYSQKKERIALMASYKEYIIKIENAKEKYFGGYTINGYTYYSLRELADFLADTQYSCQIKYDYIQNSLFITSDNKTKNNTEQTINTEVLKVAEKDLFPKEFTEDISITENKLLIYFDNTLTNIGSFNCDRITYIGLQDFTNMFDMNVVQENDKLCLTTKNN